MMMSGEADALNALMDRQIDRQAEDRQTDRQTDVLL